MNKSAIKKYAVWARRELISRVGQRAMFYGITHDDTGNIGEENINGKVLTAAEIKQRDALINEIQHKGYEQVMEEAAYTWFNRFCALRFMEVNGYLPTHVRVFTDEDNNFKPQILTEAINVELDGLDIDKVFSLKENNNHDELFKYLIITQCNALSNILPEMFQPLEDYTELLFPDNILRTDSVIHQMIELIPQEDWEDAVQIIGWLYQYYNSEKKDEVFAALKKNVKITKENIPAATQLFTPDWIVRYMVENSLGRLWVEGHPDVKVQFLPTKEEQENYAQGNRNSEDTKWYYYLEEAEQEPEVKAQLEEIRAEYAQLKPEDIKCIDPCSGSGHILAYMFDVLMQVYESYGYTSREAVKSIVENNIFGLDIDERAAQLANFAVLMKARQYDRRFFSRKDEDGNPSVPQPRVYAICESNDIEKYVIDYFINGNGEISKAINSILKDMHDAKEYGSIITVKSVDFNALYERVEEIKNDIHMAREAVLNKLLPLIQVAEVLSQKYHAVVTNPPYMGASGMGGKLSEYVKQNYPDSKSDLFAVFIEKWNKKAISNGMNCMVTMQSWMFLSSFEKMRTNALSNHSITCLMHMENMVMGIAFGTAVTCFRNTAIPKYKGVYNQIKLADIVNDKPKKFPVKENRFAYTTTDNFSKIPGSPVAYWVSEAMLKAFKEDKLVDIANPRQGLATGENNRFVRNWFECSILNTKFDCSSISDSENSGMKWFPYNKGGEFRKWYGNNDFVVNWENDGLEIRNFKDEQGKLRSRPQNTDAYFKKCITWSKISSGSIAFRYKPVGHIFDVAGTSVFANNDLLYYLLALCNSGVALKVFNAISPTLNYEVGHVASLPVNIQMESKGEIDKITKENISLSKSDWDAFETSWDFNRHPLVHHTSKLLEAYTLWQSECEDRFNQLKANEEELNRIFIDIYGLQDELTPEVEDKDVTVRKADLQRDIKSLISYAVGCMFGRYSLDEEGLAYAGGEWDESKYRTFEADADNVIPICDDEYFEDDIVGRFVKFIETVYGKDTLDENLKFIADALGGKGQPKEVIRNYFIKDFYKDHCKIYQKRPIYWLFDSGKNGGFKALIYMHRYKPDTLARIRTDYVHEQQARYRTALNDLEMQALNADTKNKVKLNKEIKSLCEQMDEIHAYEEKIHHLADQMIEIDLDDGVKHNYAIFEDVLAKVK